jgi:hypothetical protein
MNDELNEIGLFGNWQVLSSSDPGSHHEKPALEYIIGVFGKYYFISA